jgi:hypothetical protein
MPRPARVPPPPSRMDDDPVYWFARLVRAVTESDWPLASCARDQLRDCGWEARQARLRPDRKATGSEVNRD